MRPLVGRFGHCLAGWVIGRWVGVASFQVERWLVKQTGPRTDIKVCAPLENDVADNIALELHKGKASQGLSHAVGELLVGLDPDKLELLVTSVAMFAQEVVRNPNMSREFRSCMVVGEVNAGLLVSGAESPEAVGVDSGSNISALVVSVVGSF